MTQTGRKVLHVDKTSGARRTGVLLTVALLHGAAAVGILAAFAGGMVQDVIIHVPRYTPTPDATPTPEPTVAPRKAAITTARPDNPVAPRPPIDLGGGSAIQTIVLPLGPAQILPPSGPIEPGGGPVPTPTPGFAPKAPRPLGKPGLWVGNADYPTGAMRRGEQGVTGFALTVGPDGRVRECAVTRSSGSPELDAATCAKVSARARFAPATGSNGEAVTGDYANSIRWEIPAQ